MGVLRMQREKQMTGRYIDFGNAMLGVVLLDKLMMLGASGDESVLFRKIEDDVSCDFVVNDRRSSPTISTPNS